MKRFGAILTMLVLILAIAADAADAAGPGSYTCSGGSSSAMNAVPAGTYTAVTVTGIVTFSAPSLARPSGRMAPRSSRIAMRPAEP